MYCIKFMQKVILSNLGWYLLLLVPFVNPSDEMNSGPDYSGLDYSDYSGLDYWSEIASNTLSLSRGKFSS